MSRQSWILISSCETGKNATGMGVAAQIGLTSSNVEEGSSMVVESSAFDVQPRLASIAHRSLQRGEKEG